MVISSDADFAIEGWTGEGSPTTPYMIEWIEFTSAFDDACIRISDTRAYFKIMNCSFAPPTMAHAILMNNVSNGQILYSTTNANAYIINAQASSDLAISHLTIPHTLIVMDQSWQCTISNCHVDTAPGDGVYLTGCSQMTVEGCELTNNAASGISLMDTGETTITGNRVQDNGMEEIFISGDSSGNYIYNNEIHTGLEGVRDNGYSNTWDNGVSIGNWWSDYSGTGTYTISGTAGSQDRYPRGPTSTEPPILPTTPNTNTETLPTTPGTPTPGQVLITSFAPMSLPIRVMLVLSIGVSYGALVILYIKRLR